MGRKRCLISVDTLYCYDSYSNVWPLYSECNFVRRDGRARTWFRIRIRTWDFLKLWTRTWLITDCDLRAIALEPFQCHVLFLPEDHKVCKNKKEEMSNSSSAVISQSNLLWKFRYIASLIQIKPIWAFIWWTAPNTF